MRYLPHTETDRQEMLKTIGVDSIDDLFVDVPPAARRRGVIDDLPLKKSELAVDRYMRGLAEQNLVAGHVPFFCGAGAYRHHVPATVDHLIQRSEYLTAYTPYQPEISQGTLQTLFEFQSQVALLTGMDVANASMYDGSTAAAEAVIMASRVTRRKKAIVSGGVHPQYTEAMDTLARYSGLSLMACDSALDHEAGVLDHLDEDVACVVVQTPNVFGTATDLRAIADAAHEKGALLIVVVAEVVSLGLMVPPGEMGADIVVAEGQSIGNGLNFGGPYVGLFATRDKYVRQMPGRVCGETVDANGRKGYVLTLSTREQHIRRDKATSNICTNAGLCALAFTIHMTLLGEVGLKRLAKLNHANALVMAKALKTVPGVEVLTTRFFNEIAVKLPKPAEEVAEALARKRILGGVPFSRLKPGERPDVMLMAATEMCTDDDIAQLIAGLKEVLS